MKMITMGALALTSILISFKAKSQSSESDTKFYISDSFTVCRKDAYGEFKCLPFKKKELSISSNNPAYILIELPGAVLGVSVDNTPFNKDSTHHFFDGNDIESNEHVMAIIDTQFGTADIYYPEVHYKFKKTEIKKKKVVTKTK